MNESAKKASRKLSPLKLFFILAVLLGGIYFAQRSGANPQQYKNDFNVYYFAAQEMVAGRTPYDNSLGAWTPYLYPPLLAELLVPLAALPLPFAAYSWFLISAFSLLAALRMSARLVVRDEQEFVVPPSGGSFIKEKSQEFGVPPSGGSFFKGSFRLKAVLQTLTLIILLRFVLDNFDYGQVNILVAALALAHLYFYSKDKKILSAIALVLAVSIKITPLVFLLYHLAKGRVKFAAACVALLVVVTALSFAPFGSRAPAAFRTFVNRTINNEQGFNLAYHGNQSLRAAIERIKGNTEATDPASTTTMIIGLAFLALAFFAAFKAKKQIAAAALFFCLSALLSPLSWKQHFVILILPIAFLISQVLRQPTSRVKKFSLATLAITFALFNLTSPKLIGLAAAEWCDGHSLVFIGAVLIFLAIVASSLLPSRSDCQL
ncbi:MAG: DUF2029 domain-containing protein [Acidobacteria bacterium]|nr:DUF2029 domain-containing protein [Acidobacteriota bacterium]